jgi:hypothetical protein
LGIWGEPLLLHTGGSVILFSPFAQCAFSWGTTPPESRTRCARIQPGPLFRLRPSPFLGWLWGAVRQSEQPVTLIVFVLHRPITYQFQDSTGVVEFFQHVSLGELNVKHRICPPRVD